MRGLAGTNVIPAAAKCRRCGARWRQHNDGLCRICHRADQTSDPLQAAMSTLRKFIGKRYIEAQRLSGSPLEIARQQATDASNALDFISEKLREGGR